MKKLVIAMIFSLSSLFIFNINKANANDFNENFRMPDAIVVDGNALVYPSIYVNFHRDLNYEIITMYIQHDDLEASSTGSEVLIAFDTFIRQKYGIPYIELLIDGEVVQTVTNQTMYSGILEFNSWIASGWTIGDKYVIKITWRLYSPVESEYEAGFVAGEEAGFENGKRIYGIEHDGDIITALEWGEIRFNEGKAEAPVDHRNATEIFLINFDKWIVPAIIVVMFVGGFFAVVRRKRDEL